MKRHSIVFISVLFSLLVSLNQFYVKADANIKIGDYMQMGKYYDEPIIWRCVNIDNNGALMLSDKILCFKSFDAKGSHIYLDGTPQADESDKFRTSSGSNIWETSNLRSWLNSTDSSGNVKFVDGCIPSSENVYSVAYDQEAGFLSDNNFLAYERNIIKTVTQKTVIHNVDVNKLKTTGTELFKYEPTIYSCVQNYDSAYGYNVTDKMFLLDVKQTYKICDNYEILGNNYWICKATKKAVDNSGFNNMEDRNWKYWLRTPSTLSYYPESIRYVDINGYIGADAQAVGCCIGVRPAFYMNTTTSKFKTNTDGTASNPYEINNCLYVDNANFKTSSQIYTSIPNNAGAYDFTTTYVNNSSNTISNSKYIVVVKSNNKVISTFTITKTFQPNETFTFVAPITLPSAEDAPNLQIEAVVWKDFNNISPCCPPLVLTRN